MKKQNKAVVPEVVNDEATIAGALTAQYEAATGAYKTAVAEVLRFGAMLVKAEEIVFAEQGGKKHLGPTAKEGYGLESWLGEHCPSINYKTAMRWKKIAEGACKSISICNRDAALKLLTGEKITSEEVEDGDVKLLENHVAYLYEAKSIRQLSQMCFDFASEDARGATAPHPKTQLPKMKKSDEAKAIWNYVLQAVTKSAVKDAIPLLPEKETEIAYQTISDIAKMLKKHLEEF